MAWSLKTHALLIVILVVTCIKAAIFVLDPLPIFFLGDSATYLHTAVVGSIPPDRSYTYGYFIRALGVWTDSLTPVVVAQVAASGVTACLVGYLLLRVFDVRPWVAVIIAAACAVDPLQLIHERLLLTEAITLLLLAVYLSLIVNYIDRPAILKLLAVHVVGLLMFSLRFPLILLTLAYAVLVPMLAVQGLQQPAGDERGSLNQRRRWWPRFAPLAIHLAFSVAVVLTLHAGYKQLTGHLSRRPPAYQYADGLFLVSAWAPFIDAIDAPDPRLAAVVAETPRLHDRSYRNQHRWEPNGFVARIRRAIPSGAEANQLAKQMALRALARRPYAVVLLAASTYGDYWDLEAMKWELIRGQGSDRTLPPSMIARVKREFHLNADVMPTLQTLTKRYHRSGRLWYAALLLTPFVALAAVFCCRREGRPAAILFALTATIILTVTCTMSLRAIIRYLQPLSFFMLIAIGILLDAGLTASLHSYRSARIGSTRDARSAGT